MKKIKLLLCLFMLTTLCGCSNSDITENMQEKPYTEIMQ